VQKGGLANRGRSPAVVRPLTDFGAEESFGQVSARFSEPYGWDVGRTERAREADLVEQLERTPEQ